jgi:catechol 2,3-dioxygenase-like lactoylglutathione lyase family enzyme
MPAPPIAVVETALYAADLAAMKAFYIRVLGLSLLAEEPTRHVFFHVGPAQVLLIFNPDVTQQGETLPAHGSVGAGHLALGVPVADLAAWRTHLAAEGVAIEAEITWPRGGQSLYFRDPGGNSVELVTPGVWGTPAGW